MRIPLLLAATLLLVAGCGDETGDDEGDTTGQDSTALDGRTFVATAITDLGKEHRLVDGSELRITFEGDEVGLNAGCNHMGATYAIDNNLLVVSGMSTTEMGCSQPLMDQDAWVSELFMEPVSYALEGGDELVLTAGDIVIRLTDREVVSPDRPLEGTTWTLDSLVTGDAVSSVPGDVVATLLIEGGELQVDNGCNMMGAAVTVDEATLTISEGRWTLVGCPPDVAAVEDAMYEVLQGPVNWTIEEKSLTLMNGDQGLGFRTD